MMEQLQKMLGPIQRRVALSIGRAVLNVISDEQKAQLVQASLLADEVRDGMERMAEYGFTSVPLPGAEGVAVFVGGDRGHGIVIATGDSRYRLTGLQGGEVALYTDEGDKIVLKRGRLIEIETQTFVVKAGVKVRFETPIVEGTGDILDNADDAGLSMSGMRSVFNIHDHNENDAGGPTDPPNQSM